MFFQRLISLVILCSLFTIQTSISLQPTSANDNSHIEPRVIDVYPFPGVEMMGNEPLTIGFNTAMNHATVEKAFQFEPTLDGEFTWVNDFTLSFSPKSNWGSNISYALTLDTTAESKAGIHLTESYSTIIETISSLELTSISPANNATEVPKDTQIVLTFNYAVVALTATTSANELSTPFEITPSVSGTGAWINSALYVFTPDEPLVSSTTYDILVNPDLQSVNGASFADDFSSSFTTASATVLRVDTEGRDSSNSNKDYDVPLDTTITISFSEAMDHQSTANAVHLYHIETIFDDEGAWSDAVYTEATGSIEWNEDSTILYFTPHELLQRTDTTHIRDYGELWINYQVTIDRTALTQYGLRPLKSQSFNEDIPSYTFNFTTLTLPGVQAIEKQRAWNDATWQPGDFPVIRFRTPMDLTTLQDYISIDPEPENWEMLDNSSTYVYLSYYSQAETTYTITVHAGATDLYGDTIQDNYVYSYTVGQVPDMVRFAMDFNQFVPIIVTNAYRKDTVFPFVVNGNPYLNFDLYELNPTQITFEGYGYTINNVTEAPLYRQWVSYMGDRHAVQQPENIPLASAEGGQLPPGFYVLRINGFARYYGENTYYSDDYLDVPLAVTNANITLKRTPTQVWALVTDIESAKPLPHIPVTLFNKGVEIGSGITDENGIFTYNVSLYDDQTDISENTEIIVVAETPDIYGIWYSWQEPSAPTEAFYIYTDRPIYRPNETIYFKGFLLDRWDMDFSAPAENTVVHVTAGTRNSVGGYESLIEVDIPLNEFGGFSGSLELPADVALGSLRIYAQIGRHYQEFYQNHVISSSINVEIAEFRVNNFEVEINTLQNEIIQGDPLQIDIAARYYSGESLSNARVNLYTAGCLKPFYYKGEGNYRFYDENWQMPAGVFYYGESYDRYGNCTAYSDSPNLPKGHEEQLSYEFSTSANGLLTVDTSRTIFYNHRPTQMMVEATIRSGEQYISGQSFVTAHPAETYIGLRSNSGYSVVLGEQTEFEMLTVNLDSTPASEHPVDIIFEKLDWEQYKHYDAYGWYYRWRIKTTLIDETSLKTDTNGLAHYQYKPELAGTYRIRTITYDDAGRQNSATYRIYVTGQEFRGWSPSPDNRLEITTTQDSYEIGDELALFVALPTNTDWTIWLSIERTDIIYQEVFQISGSSFEQILEISEEFTSHATISITALRGATFEDTHPQYYLASKQIRVAMDHRELSIEIAPSTRTSTPGEEVSFAITVVDQDSNPVPNSELSVKLTDEAILALLPPNANTIDNALYGYVWNSVQSSVSLSRLLDRYIIELPNPFSGGYGGGGCCRGPQNPRIEFEQTPLWEPHIITDIDGSAVVSVVLPDNLTRWQLEVKAFTADGYFGESTTTITTNLPLTIRPITPRFFVVGDHIQIGAIVSNNTDQSQQITTFVDGSGVLFDDDVIQEVIVPAHTQQEVYWLATVEDVIGVDLTFAAENEQGATDATKPMLTIGEDNTIPVYRYVAPDIVATAGVLPNVGRNIEGIQIPYRLLNADGGDLVLTLDSSLAETTLDGLDYLQNYPHQCIEQTVSRFFPNIVTYRALTNLGVDDETLEANLLEAYEIGHSRLLATQGSGSWGWFGSAREPNVQVTAYATLALLEAQDAGLEVDQEMIDRAIQYLGYHIRSVEYLTESVNSHELNEQAFLYYAIARQSGQYLAELDSLYNQRSLLSHQSKAFLLMTYVRVHPDSITIPVLLDEFKNSAVYTATGIYWEDPSNGYHWTTSTRSTALVLKAFLAAEPDNEMLSQVVRWLILRRETSHWSNTQETVWAILALTDWMVYTQELQSLYTFEVQMNGNSVWNGNVTDDMPLDSDELTIAVEDLLVAEINQLSIARSQGTGSLYYTAYLNLNLNPAEVASSGRGMTVEREYIVDKESTENVSSAKKGDLITVRINFTIANPVYYFVLEDFIPSGTEIVDAKLLTTTHQSTGEQIQSGDYWNWGWWWFDHTELKHTGARLYADYLPAGSYTYSYQVRAAFSGEFQTIPTHAYEFYTPDIYGTSSGIVFTIDD